MGIVGEKLDIDFVISTGDNFYDDGLVGVDDPAFHSSFSNIYTAPSLQKQWYIVLGNHDYRGDVLAQLSPILRKRDSRFLCLRSFILNAALKHSTAKWKIVVGHHTIKSASQHGNTLELESQLLPILEENNVDFYINGHDHCLEHIIDTKSHIQFLTSGGGSMAWRGDIKWWNPEELKLFYDGQGFMSVELTKKAANFSYYDVFGNVLHKWSLSKELDSFA
ncbi:hypothetical protein TIFTF001_007573 [Ficus carica]|uniref:Calcineurin-like phosphoesterase domain-containing protein n=1 Tax=Ficus carica TaxID=3494 RepID=A0AA87ZLI8_FICCA|nr:hypothetical protein TIFTF001_007573 [Ficus carica]